MPVRDFSDAGTTTLGADSAGNAPTTGYWVWYSIGTHQNLYEKIVMDPVKDDGAGNWVADDGRLTV